MALLDNIVPVAPRDPFARGALVPATVMTRNSTYSVTELALLVNRPPQVIVTCEAGTFAGTSWLVDRSEVVLTRDYFHVGGDVGLHTTRPQHVNGYPVETWEV